MYLGINIDILEKLQTVIVRHSKFVMSSQNGDIKKLKSTESRNKRKTQRVKVLKPLISESVLDADSQKYYVLALFILLQAWKLYDLFLLQKHAELQSLLIDTNDYNSGFLFFGFLHPRLSFIFKYLFLDSLIILSVPFFNIPNLFFTPSFSIVLLIVVNSITLLLTCTYSFAISSVFYSIYKTLIPEKELTIMEQYMDAESIINQSEHFKGKKTIRYAPDSSVKINPYDQQFCIRPVYNDKIKIPIKIDSVYDLNYLQLAYQDFNNDIMLFNFTSRDIKNFVVTDYYNSPYSKVDPSVLAASNIQLLEIPVDRPGYYSIKLATDRKDKQIRSFKSSTIIPVCPEAYFSQQPSFSSDKCVDDTVDDLTITVLGVPPFTLFYEEEINGKLSRLLPATIKHLDNIDSPLVARDSSKKINYASNYLREISWAKSYNITIPVGNRVLQNEGTYIYTINNIVDGFGNKISYTPDPSNRATFVSFFSHARPVLNLVDSDPNLPILIDREKYLNIAVSNTQSVAKESPFDIEIKYIEDSRDENSIQIIGKQFDVSNSPNLRFKAEKPGTYIIARGSSKYCDCKIGTNSIEITAAELPKMDVSLDPIIDTCVGTTGFKFSFDFIGNAPFEINYKISRLDPNDSNRVIRVEKTSLIRSDASTNEFDFQPSSEGSYSIELISLSDRYYKNKVMYHQGEYRYVTYFKQKPRAYFRKDNKIQKLKSCFGESSSVLLNIEGKPPFKVSFDIVAPDHSVQNYVLNDIIENKIYIDTPQLDKGGKHIIILREVQDSSDCEVEFKGQEAHIDVKSEIPKISFVKNEVIEIVKGSSYVVPLKTQYNQPVDITYNYQSFDGKEFKKIDLRHHDPSRGLKLSKDGLYKLYSFSQDGCPGEISEEFEVQIKYLPFPQIKTILGETLSETSKNQFTKEKVCVNQNEQIGFELIGSGPFVVEYEVTYPDGRIKSKIEQVNISKFDISLETSNAGLHHYQIKKLYDSIYDEEILNGLSLSNRYHFEPLMFMHEVTPLPSAKFIDNDHKIQACISSLHDLDKVEPINVIITGKLPVTLKVDIYHESDGSLELLEFTKIETLVVDLLSIYKHIGLGSHVVSINQVIDANGCISDESILNKESITIQVNDIPKIRHLVEESNQLSDINSETNYYCVGDQISYMLNGVPPFHIIYEFNSVSQEASVRSNYFKRRAPAPGELIIKSLSDSAARDCAAEFGDSRKDLRARIYDLPSAEIVQGDSVEEDIHEGEQVEIIFLLTGTPPFKLTYIRKELDASSKIVETEIVEDIQSNEYRIMANLEGTYEAIEIQDRYCVARNHRI